MKYYIISIAIGLLSVNKLSCQSNGKPIYIDLINKYYYPYKGLTKDTIETSKKELFVVELIDAKGRLRFELYQNKKLIAKGIYSNSLDTFKRYGINYNINGDAKKIVENYYYPLRDSTWTFYNSKSKKYYSKIYDKGIEK